MNRIITLCFAILLVLTTNTAVGQNINHYSGNYKGGTAEYDYYENSAFDRIMHGSFTFTTKDNITINGQFIENKRNGPWRISATNQIIQLNTTKIKATFQISGNFDHGNFEGPWSFYSCVQLQDIVNGGFQLEKEIRQSTATFKNNHFTGKYHFEYSGNSKYQKIDGYFTEDGFRDSTWTYEYNKIIETFKFNNGINFWRLKKHKETGEKLIFKDTTQFVIKFWNNYNTNTSNSIVGGNTYFLDTIDGTVAHPEWMDEPFGIWATGVITNPLYILKEGSNEPNCFDLKIIQCDPGDSDPPFPCQNEPQNESTIKEDVGYFSGSSKVDTLSKHLPLAIPSNSDFMRLSNAITYDFFKWARKSDFETTEEHKTRLSSESRQKVSKLIHIYEQERGQSRPLYATLNKYEIENQEYSMKLFDLSYGGTEKGEINLRIPPNLAKSLSEYYAGGEFRFLYIPTESCYSNYSLVVTKAVIVMDITSSFEFKGCLRSLYDFEDAAVSIRKIQSSQGTTFLYEISCGMPSTRTRADFVFSARDLKGTEALNPGIYYLEYHSDVEAQDIESIIYQSVKSPIRKEFNIVID